jgi:hypothetical protein
MVKRLLIALLLPGLCLADHVLENAQARIAFDEKGAVTELVDKQSAAGHNLIARRLSGFWKLIFHRGRVYENVVAPEQQQYRFAREGDRLVISVDRVRFEDETLPIQLRFTVRLEGDEVRWTARIENRSQVTVADFFFPQIGGIDALGGAGSDDLIWPSAAGMRMRNVKASMRAGVGGLTSIDEPVNTVADPRLDLLYPSGSTVDEGASMSWYEWTNGSRGVYFASYDPRFQSGLLRVSRLFQAGGALQFSFAKFLLLGPGETWTSGESVVSPHAGTWHVGAAKYRKWADTWFRRQARPEWVDRMKGMLLVILRQQYGDRMWSYSDLPYLFDEARKSGVDTVALFGWTEGGHDNKYPVYEPDPEMGGESGLRQGLAAVRKAGGNTILYINGHIMDAGSPFYKETGVRMAARNIWGSPYYEQYSKSHESAFLAHFSHKLFAPACPGDAEWEKVMRGVGTRLLGYGPSGVIYDQVGGMPPYPCFGTDRKEPLSEIFTAGRLRYLAAIRANARQSSEKAGLMGEHICDLYAQFMDVIHGVHRGFSPSEPAFPQMVRYTFPEVVMTSRNAAPRLTLRQSNFALAYGFRFETEVRYRADVETVRRREKPELQEYQRSISALRDRYWDLLGAGRFLDDRGLVNRNREVTATLFAQGKRNALVVWNNTAVKQEVKVEVTGKRFVEAAGVKGVLAARPGSLAPQEVAVLIYE